MTGTVSKTGKAPHQGFLRCGVCETAGLRLGDEFEAQSRGSDKIVTAASELGRNTLEHGGGGELEIAEVVEGVRKGTAG